MKHIILSLALVAGTFGLSANATDDFKVNPNAEKALNKEFVGARNIRWQQVRGGDLFQARFTYNDERLNAYFNADGTLVAISRFISGATLPLLASKEIHSTFSEYTAEDILEYTIEGETSYIANLVKDNKRLVVRLYPAGGSSIISKEKINIDKKL